MVAAMIHAVDVGDSSGIGLAAGEGVGGTGA